MHNRVDLFLAHRYAAVLIILLVGTGPDPELVWCNAPLPLCNQAQTRWLKVLVQLPVWKALLDPHQRCYSHGLQTPLGYTHMAPKQSGQLFLPHQKKERKNKKKNIPQVQRLLIDVNWFVPLPLHCIRFSGQWGYQSLARMVLLDSARQTVPFWEKRNN